MTAIFRMTEDDRCRAASRHIGRRVTVRWNPLRSASAEDREARGYLVSVARIPGGALLIVLDLALDDGIGDMALPLSQVRSITRDPE